MKKALTLSLTLLIATFLMAQKTMQDVVYLKNGSILKGKITPTGRPASVSIELWGGSTLVVPTADIDSIKKENLLKARVALLKRDYFRRNSGYRHTTELGIIYGTNLKNTGNTYYYNPADDFGLSLHTVNGYQWWPYLFTGAGMGIDRYITYGQTFSPFYLRLASEFLKKKVTPYVFADAGYAVMWKQRKDDGLEYKNKGGLYIAAGAGIRIYTFSRASVLLSLAYKRCNSESKWWYTGNEGYIYATQRTYQRIVFNVGVSF